MASSTRHIEPLLPSNVIYTYARPSADLSTANWTTAPLWSKVDEALADDADFISSPVSPATAAADKMSLSTVPTPPITTNHTLYYRYRKDSTGGDTLSFTISLYQGATLIASQTDSNVSGSGWINGSMSVDGSLISDYSNLSVQVSAVKV